MRWKGRRHIIYQPNPTSGQYRLWLLLHQSVLPDGSPPGLFDQVEVRCQRHIMSADRSEEDAVPRVKEAWFQYLSSCILRCHVICSLQDVHEIAAWVSKNTGVAVWPMAFQTSSKDEPTTSPPSESRMPQELETLARGDRDSSSWRERRANEATHCVRG